MHEPRSIGRILAGLQGLYYAMFGLWPLVHMRSFIYVTGQRGKYDNAATGQELDHWLIVTVSLLLVTIGASLLLAGRRDAVTLELAVLGCGGAAALAMVDLLYASRKIIEPIYLLDAAAEVGFVAMWLIAWHLGLRQVSSRLKT